MSEVNLNTDKNKTCVLILGMHRSGTSALTRIINLLGYKIPKKLVGGDESNERGHWESENIVIYNDRLLTDMKSSWFDFCKLPSMDPELTETKHIQMQLIELLQREYENKDFISIKDPRLCRLSPLYIRALGDLGYNVIPVISFRNPVEVVRSLKNRHQNWPEGYGNLQAAMIWLRYTLDAEYDSRNMKRSFCEYTDILRNWRYEIHRIADQGGIFFPDYNESSISKIDDFLHPDLRHEVEDSINFPDYRIINDWCKKSYEALKELVIDPDSSNAKNTLDEIRVHMDNADPIISEITKDNSKYLRKLFNDIKNNHADFKSLEKINHDLSLSLDNKASELQTALKHADEKDIKISDLIKQVNNSNKKIDEFMNSNSWKITAPLRSVKSLVHRIQERYEKSKDK